MTRFRFPDGRVYDPDKPPVKRTAKGLPAGEEVKKQVKAEVTKAVLADLAAKGISGATVASALANERAGKVEALQEQAKAWRQKALDGRVNGLDREVRELYVRKAVAAEAAAERLRKGETVSPQAQAKADELESQAREYDRKAADAGSGLASYYRDKARECRTLAALARGEKPETAESSRSMSFTA